MATLEETTDRTALREHLRHQRHREAARIAGRLAREGAWDAGVAATLFLYGRRDSPERARAAAWLAVPVAALRVEGALTDTRSWDELLLALVEVGRAADAIEGLVLAAEAGLVSVESHLGLVLALVRRGELDAAWSIAAIAVAQFPRDGRAWSTVAFLALELGDLERAERAVETALRLSPGLPDALLTRALVAARRGNPEAAHRLLDEARRAEVPLTILEGYRRLAGL
jgi:tetratricopeptide (TPR) repeat protein